MSNFASSLKSEIARVTRKVVKDDLAGLRRTSTAHRSEIAALKRECKALAAQVRQLGRALASAGRNRAVEPPRPERTRVRRPAVFDAGRFAAQRRKLGLTQADMAQLVGASSLSVYKWESGRVQPRAAQLARITEVRGIGKRAALARLAR